MANTFRYKSPDANAAAQLTGGTVVRTTSSLQCVEVTGFPANTVVQPGDMFYKPSGGSGIVVSSRSVLNGSGAGRIYFPYGISFTAADVVEIRRPLPSALATYFTNGGLIFPFNYNLATEFLPVFDVYYRPAPATGLKLYLGMSCMVRGILGYNRHQLVIAGWTSGTAIATYQIDSVYADGYGTNWTTETAGAWSTLDVAFEVDSTLLTDWRYKVQWTNSGTGTGSATTVEGNKTFYVQNVAFYWSEAAVGSFKWSYDGACHKAWDYGSDALFDRSEPLVNYQVQALEMDPAKPYVLGATCDLRDGTIRATPQVVAWRRTLEAESSELPLPQLTLDNRAPTLTQALVDAGSV